MAHSTSLSDDEKEQLIQAAQSAISYGLEFGVLWQVDPTDYPQALCETAACFVSLTVKGELRGCIGTLEPINPLVVDVVNNAYAAAFGDPRFPPISHAEGTRLEIGISILNPTSPITFESEADLAAQLQPEVDGLILKAGNRSATFLPSVWKDITRPENFIQALKVKAGMPPDYWSRAIVAERYSVDEVKNLERQV